MYQLHSFGKNEKGRDFIVGDIHGVYDQLFNLLASVNFDKNIDRLFSVGDLIDRGPKSLEVLALNNEDWFFAILGNHETMLLTGHLAYAKDWYNELTPEDKDKCLTIIKKLPLAIEIETSIGLVGLVHAQVPQQFNDWNEFKNYLRDANLSHEMNSIKDSGKVIRDALWSRKRIYMELKKNGVGYARKAYIKFLKDGLWNRTTLYRIITTRKTLPYLKHGISFSFRYVLGKFKKKLRHKSYIDNVTYTFHGHTPVKKPLLLGNQFFIDTGAVYGMKQHKQGALTIIEISDDLKVHTLVVEPD